MVKSISIVISSVLVSVIVVMSVATAPDNNLSKDYFKELNVLSQKMRVLEAKNERQLKMIENMKAGKSFSKTFVKNEREVVVSEIAVKKKKVVESATEVSPIEVDQDKLNKIVDNVMKEIDRRKNKKDIERIKKLREHSINAYSQYLIKSLNLDSSLGDNIKQVYKNFYKAGDDFYEQNPDATKTDKQQKLKIIREEAVTQLETFAGHSPSFERIRSSMNNWLRHKLLDMRESHYR